jgi:hypothetical protein
VKHAHTVTWECDRLGKISTSARMLQASLCPAGMREMKRKC